MILTQDEQATLNALNKKHFDLIAKFFIRPFEGLPKDFVNVPNESLGEIVKAQMAARESNKLFLADMKAHVASTDTEPSPVAPA